MKVSAHASIYLYPLLEGTLAMRRRSLAEAALPSRRAPRVGYSPAPAPTLLHSSSGANPAFRHASAETVSPVSVPVPSP